MVVAYINEDSQDGKDYQDDDQDDRTKHHDSDDSDEIIDMVDDGDDDDEDNGDGGSGGGGGGHDSSGKPGLDAESYRIAPGRGTKRSRIRTAAGAAAATTASAAGASSSWWGSSWWGRRASLVPEARAGERVKSRGHNNDIKDIAATTTYVKTKKRDSRTFPGRRAIRSTDSVSTVDLSCSASASTLSTSAGGGARGTRNTTEGGPKL